MARLEGLVQTENKNESVSVSVTLWEEKRWRHAKEWVNFFIGKIENFWAFYFALSSSSEGHETFHKRD